MPSISGTALLLIVLGGLWLCLWQTRWRALGLVIVAAGLMVSGEGEKPDVLVERDGRNVALRAEDGSLAQPPVLGREKGRLLPAGKLTSLRLKVPRRLQRNVRRRAVGMRKAAKGEGFAVDRSVDPSEGLSS